MVKSSSYISIKHTIYTLGFALVFTLAGCSGGFTEEIKYVETIQTSLENNEANFDIDISLFKGRISYIQETLRTFTNDFEGEMPLELGNQLSKLKGIKKIYSKRVGEYETNLKEQEELKKQLSNLTIDLKNSSISKEEFKTFISTEQADIDRLLSSSIEIKKAFYEIESEYTRISGTIEQELAKIKP
jgi:hypothetical protein